MAGNILPGAIERLLSEYQKGNPMFDPNWAEEMENLDTEPRETGVDIPVLPIGSDRLGTPTPVPAPASTPSSMKDTEEPGSFMRKEIPSTLRNVRKEPRPAHGDGRVEGSVEDYMKRFKEKLKEHEQKSLPKP